MSSLRWTAREVGASLRHFVRLASRDEVDGVRIELAEVRRSIAELERAVERLEGGPAGPGAGATSGPPSQGPGTP